MSLGAPFTSVIAAARTGAPWALEALYRDLHPRLLRYLRVHELGMAEDLASDAWIGVAKGLPGFVGDEDDFRAFVFTVARRRVLDHRGPKHAGAPPPAIPGRWKGSGRSRTRSPTRWIVSVKVGPSGSCWNSRPTRRMSCYCG